MSKPIMNSWLLHDDFMLPESHDTQISESYNDLQKKNVSSSIFLNILKCVRLIQTTVIIAPCVKFRKFGVIFLYKNNFYFYFQVSGNNQSEFSPQICTDFLQNKFW